MSNDLRSGQSALCNSATGSPLVSPLEPRRRGPRSHARGGPVGRHLPIEIPTAAHEFRHRPSLLSLTRARRDVDFRNRLQTRPSPVMPPRRKVAAVEFSTAGGENESEDAAKRSAASGKRECAKFLDGCGEGQASIDKA